ncbi:hypothetical protein BgiBS90_027709 [Biomphalaria glabrata]|nr:hypothetical protein BgiBS90_027709 [Biomphalaria glabrata]
MLPNVENVFSKELHKASFYDIWHVAKGLKKKIGLHKFKTRGRASKQLEKIYHQTFVLVCCFNFRWLHIAAMQYNENCGEETDDTDEEGNVRFNVHKRMNYLFDEFRKDPKEMTKSLTEYVDHIPEPLCSKFERPSWDNIKRLTRISLDTNSSFSSSSTPHTHK